jgi:uncharacterized membrane protein
MTPRTGRQAYLDRVRGFAVLVMIEAHVLDSWTRQSDRHSTAYRYAIILGGFGAPLFLFLAGVTFVLSAESKYRKTGDFEASWWAVQKRGWQIFALAFLFRLQSFILTGGYNLIGLLNVDILNVMGPAIVFMGFIGSRSKTRFGRALVLAVLTAGVAMLTPIVRATPLLNWLPDPIQWYFRASPARSNFTLFPWAAFVFAGAVVGEVIDGLRSADRAFRLQMALAAAGILVIVASYEASLLPSIYPASDFWTSSPTFFFLRVGFIALLLPLMFLWDRTPWRGAISQWSPMEELGQASLFVYWIHVEMVYGFISRPLRRNLSFPAAIVADALFSAFILALVLLKNRVVTMRKEGSLSTAGPTPASI